MLRTQTIAWHADLAKPPMLTHGLLQATPGIAHGFFTRQGGFSTSPLYQSLNCGVGSKDDRALILKNRNRAAKTLGVSPLRLATPYQVHGTDAAVVDRVWETGQGPTADAVVTKELGVAVGICTADCGPVLFADTEARVVGAAHAGWRGALAGILESTIVAMEGLGARRNHIVAVVGPMISQRHYEVGPELVAQFTDADPANERWFRPSEREGHALFDLPRYILARLTAAGVIASDLGLCTYADEERFFSYRRATHRGEADYGRLLSAIALVE